MTLCPRPLNGTAGRWQDGPAYPNISVRKGAVPMNYVIGIDSGGTHYRVLACDLQGGQLGSYTGQPANHYCMPYEEVSERVNRSIDACLAQFGGRREEARCLVCGTTGLDSAEDEALLRGLYQGLPGFACPVRVINDAELAHYTVTGGEGVLVISGTGSIAFGRSRAGKTARAGGWMFSILGDEGSGTWVSRAALHEVARWLDGAAPAGPMVQSVCSTLGIADRGDLNRIAARSSVPPWQVPALGKLVNKAAGEGDEAARAILKQAAGMVFSIVEDLVRSLGLEQTEPDFKLGVWGSSILHSAQTMEEFRALAARRFPQAVLCLPGRTAAQGAVSMALELIG